MAVVPVQEWFDEELEGGARVGQLKVLVDVWMQNAKDAHLLAIPHHVRSTASEKRLI